MRRFGTHARTVVRRAETEARAEGSRLIEAEHLLLALTSQGETAAARALATGGLDHDALRDALDAQFREALNAAGVELDDGGLPPGRRSGREHLRMGQSAKLALQRALVATAKRGHTRIEPPHLLLGILGAQHGTVPRALAQARVDREQLIAAAEAALPRRAS
jgi:D-alanyl-D-alanine carboxypeptidase